KDTAAVEIRMTRIELRKGPGKIVRKNLVAEHQGQPLPPRGSQPNPPGLIVETCDWRVRQRAIQSGQASFARLYLLHVFGEVENGIAARRPLRHLKIQLFQLRFFWHSNFYRHFKKVRSRM